jgi:hypothetical protein
LEFLLEEFKQIHESISQNNRGISHGFQLFFGAIAAAGGALMLGLSQTAGHCYPLNTP